MTIIEEVRETFKNAALHETFSTSQIKQMVFDKFGRCKGSIIPSDYSYNMINKGIVDNTLKDFNIFIQVERGRYQYVGEVYDYKGKQQR